MCFVATNGCCFFQVKIHWVTFDRAIINVCYCVPSSHIIDDVSECTQKKMSKNGWDGEGVGGGELAGCKRKKCTPIELNKLSKVCARRIRETLYIELEVDRIRSEKGSEKEVQKLLTHTHARTRTHTHTHTHTDTHTLTLTHRHTGCIGTCTKPNEIPSFVLCFQTFVKKTPI